MPAADQLDVDGVAAVGVAAAELDRDGLVGVAVHEQHLRIRRLVDRGRRALREQALDGPGAGAELGGQRQVAHGRLREHAARADAIRREQREVPAGAVTRERDALADRSRRAAPSTAATTSSSGAGQSPSQSSLRYSTFQTARPRSGEIRRDAVLEVAPVLRAPAAAVDQHDGRLRRPPPAGQPELRDLLGVRAVLQRGLRQAALTCAGSSSRSAVAARQQSW